ncbi:hypothetical protein MXD63_41125, partial [Frankia sp. Cpl3]|nr:hypothetical protein [Frankia sp. Cpl3]
MDIEKSLQQLKETADSTFLRELTFTREMEQKVWERTKRKKRLPGIGWWGSMVVAAAVLLLVLPAIYSHSPLTPQGQGSGTKQKPVLFPGAVWQVPSLWKASPLQSATVNGLSFQYYGEKPVRIIT